jgi:hypothetical protein
MPILNFVLTLLNIIEITSIYRRSRSFNTLNFARFCLRDSKFSENEATDGTWGGQQASVLPIGLIIQLHPQ